jgi:hypothetical protein
MAALLSVLAAATTSGVASATTYDFGATNGCGFQVGESGDWELLPGIPGSCASLANNVWHALRPYSFGNQWAGISSAVQYSISEDYNPTDLVAYWTTTDNYPDVRLWDWYYPQYNAVAWVDCPADNTGVGYYSSGNFATRWCRGQIVRFNAEYAGSFNQLGRDWVACHELGHTVGLREGTNNYSCMENDWSNGVTEVLLDHDRDHINGQY